MMKQRCYYCDIEIGISILSNGTWIGEKCAAREGIKIDNTHPTDNDIKKLAYENTWEGAE